MSTVALCLLTCRRGPTARDLVLDGAGTAAWTPAGAVVHQ